MLTLYFTRKFVTDEIFLFCRALLSFYCQPECNRSIWLSKSTPWKNISSTTAFSSKVSLKYSWCVSVANGYRIRVHFQLFNLKNSTNCSSSAVELVEHDGYSFGSLGRYCGHHMPDDVVSRLRYVTVIYTITNGTVALHPGFQASLSLESAGKIFCPYSQISPKEHCKRTLNCSLGISLPYFLSMI